MPPRRRAPPPDGDTDPLGGQSRDSRAAGGLATLWRRRWEEVERQRKFRELNEQSKHSVAARPPVEDSDDDGEDPGRD